MIQKRDLAEERVTFVDYMQPDNIRMQGKKNRKIKTCSQTTGSLATRFAKNFIVFKEYNKNSRDSENRSKEFLNLGERPSQLGHIERQPDTNFKINLTEANTKHCANVKYH